VLILVAIRLYLSETRVPNPDGHPLRQLQASVREFFHHRQSIFGLLLIVVPPAGFMSMIAISSALAVDIYGYSVQAFGFIFALAGLSVLAGSIINRLLVIRLDLVQVLAIATTMMAVAGLQLLVIAWLDDVPFAWIWMNVCIFFFAVPLVFANATVLALDPLPSIAGVASSIIGTLQNVLGALGAVLGASIYNGSVRNSVLIIACAGIAAAVVYLLRSQICGGVITQHPDSPARD
jgi:DHA1 family bicyclomycin/chloramphenicol resistance-like MFS transporter